MVDVHDAQDLAHESFDEAEVPAGDADDGEQGVGVAVVAGVEGEAEALPVVAQDGSDVFGVQRSVRWTKPMRLYSWG